MDPGETMVATLRRELKEELGVTYTANPKQLTAFLTSITIPAGDIRYPLVFVIYEVSLPADVKITLDPSGPEDEYHWFAPALAAKEMAFKFPADFCELVSKLQ
jgi:8-oxo-dGTP pyrophosphatase MutT (NUDIX family)